MPLAIWLNWFMLLNVRGHAYIYIYTSLWCAYIYDVHDVYLFNRYILVNNNIVNKWHTKVRIKYETNNDTTPEEDLDYIIVFIKESI